LNPTPKTTEKGILRDIRKALLELGSATKVDLSARLGISFPTISKFLSRMEKDGELLSAGLDHSSGGRRAKRYVYNPEYRLGLAIFLERKETRYMVFNCTGEVKDAGITSSVLTEDGLTLLSAHIETIMENYPKIRSIAIGVPGAVNSGRIIYIPGYAHLQNLDMKGFLENRFSIPVVVENDMNAAVLGYHNSKGDQNHSSLVYLYSGQNGPGAGIMVNGLVVRGSTNFSGEISFVPQYDKRNFGEALGNENKKAFITEDYQIDAISRLIASFAAIINPHNIIFCNDEVTPSILDQMVKQSSTYIPAEHLPELITSDWNHDYLLGLQNLGLDLMIN
jgi:DNA-binding Lrp family transcriptional regulator